MTTLTKAQAKSQFIQLVEETTGSTIRNELKLDRVAVKQSWFDFVDSLLEDGLITEEQADNWIFPWEAK